MSSKATGTSSATKVPDMDGSSLGRKRYNRPIFNMDFVVSVQRYKLKVMVADDTAHTVVVMFNEIATELLKCSADSLIWVEDEVGSYKLKVMVADDTAHTVVVMFIEIATELLKCSADSLIGVEDEVDDGSGLPTAIRNLIDEGSSPTKESDKFNADRPLDKKKKE
nr:hypothetical protein [Tanacetum cinerariifolium]